MKKSSMFFENPAFAMSDNPRVLQWANEVKRNACWLCQNCGLADTGLLDAHHKKSKKRHPELIFDVDNGQCLCMACHIAEHINRGEWLAAILIALRLIDTSVKRICKNE